MRLVIGILLALAAGCGNTATPSNDMQADMAVPQNCPPLDGVGSPCNPACVYQGYPCGCSKAGVVTCLTRDMAAAHD